MLPNGIIMGLLAPIVFREAPFLGQWGNNYLFLISLAQSGSLHCTYGRHEFSGGDHVVRVFQGSGAMWTAVRVVAGGFMSPGTADGQLFGPCGLRFTGDGAGLAVADEGSHRVTMFCVEDGSFARHVATGLSNPLDVEECDGGWLVACSSSRTIEFVGDGTDGGGDSGEGRARLDERGSGYGGFQYPSALALVPGLCLVVRDAAQGGRLQVFATPDAIAMSFMSAWRVAWMVAVARGCIRRTQGSAVPPAHQSRTCQRGKRSRVEPH
jgi:hypothetical protein